MKLTAEVLTASAAALVALGGLLYMSPARAWKLLADSSREQLADLRKRVDRLEETVAQRDTAIAHRDAVIRRLRSIRSALESLLHSNGIAIPAFADDAPDVAPERRAPTVAVAIEPITEDPNANT